MTAQSRETQRYLAAPSITPGKLLALAPGAAPLLNDVPLTALRHVTPGGVVRHAVVFETALGRRALMDLLYALAPYKAHGPDRFARVLDNWAIFDRAKTGGGASQSLFMQHVASLKANWQTFSEHREVFVSVFDDQSEATRVMPIIRWQTQPDGTKRWDLARLSEDDVAALAEVVPLLQTPVAGDTLAGLIAVPYLLPELAKKWPTWKPLVKGGKSNYIGPASVPMMALLHKRAILNSRFIRAIEALEFD